MAPERLRFALVLGLFISSALLLAFPLEMALNTEVLLDDPVKTRIESESVGDAKNSQLVLRFRHDDGGRLTNNLSRVQELLQLEHEVMSGTDPDTAWTAEHVFIARIESPLSSWSQALASRNRSLANATQWADVLNPTLEEGWCGNGSTKEEGAAFEATLLLLPRDTNLGVACPSFSGASATQAPAADEMLWMIWMGSASEDTDWHTLSDWAEKVSEATEFEVSAVGVKMLFNKSRKIAEHDMSYILLPSLLLLGAMLAIGLRDPMVAALTIGGVVLVLTAELGILSAFGMTFSIIDAIALPIIMGVAVDGAFWYSRSSRKRDEVRTMLFVAMMTTAAAVSLALFSPIRAQRTLALVMILGIVLDWLVTRFLLEDFFLKRRASKEKKENTDSLPSHPALVWGWPLALLLLATIAITSPTGFEVLSVKQLLPEDDPAIAEMEEIQSKYVLASSTTAWIAIDISGDSSQDLHRVLDLQQQLGTHPSVLTLDTGVFRSAMVVGLTAGENVSDNTTIDQLSSSNSGSLFLKDSRLQTDGSTSGVAIVALIDGQDSDAALQFKNDVENLLEQNGLTGGIGGDLIMGASLTRDFDESRMFQIFAAGVAVFIVSYAIIGSPRTAARIAIGTLAVGIAVDGMASFMGGRGITTAPAVLLGMGFTADYLSHASSEHAPTKRDNSARWWAALSSLSAFVLLGLARFPPAKDAGNLLTISILFSVILATFLSFRHVNHTSKDFTDEEE